MNWLDVIIAASLILAVIQGFRSGFIMQITIFIGLVVSVIFAGKLSEIVLPYLSKIIDTSSYFISPISYIIAFVLITMGICLIGKTIESFIKIMQLSFFNRILGAFFSLITWAVATSVVLILIVNFDRKHTLIKEPIKQSSHFFEPMTTIGEFLVPFLKTKSEAALFVEN